MSVSVDALAQGIVAEDLARRGLHDPVSMTVFEELGRNGLMAMNVPEAWGGSGAGPVAYVDAVRSVARVCASTAVTMAVTNMVGEVVARFGTDAQRARVCAVLAAGALGAFALSESEAGSDAAALRTRATPESGGFVLDGTKQWISHGDRAAHVVVWARSGGAGARGITCYLTSPAAPGYSVVRREDKLGLEASATCELALDAVFVPEGMQLGATGGGFALAMAALDGGRIGIAAQALGLADRMLAALRSASPRNREVTDCAADGAANVARAAALAYGAAEAKLAGQPYSALAAQAKLVASETAVELGIAAQSALRSGAHAPARAVVTKALRDARVTMIYEGTSEIQRLVIARSLLASP